MNYNKIIIALVIVLVAILVAGIVVLNPVVSKTDSKIVITSANELNEGDEFAISLTDDKGNSLAKQPVHIIIIDSNGAKSERDVTTDDAGNAVITLNGLNSGQYTVNVTYGGNNTYLNSSASQELTIKEKKVVESEGTSSEPKTYKSGLTDAEIEANIQRDLDIRAQNGVKGEYNYEEARSFYENVPKEGMI